MVRMNKLEFERFCLEKYPKLKKQEAIDKMKSNYHVTVINRSHSSKKKYVVCESLL